MGVLYYCYGMGVAHIMGPVLEWRALAWSDGRGLYGPGLMGVRP